MFKSQRFNETNVPLKVKMQTILSLVYLINPFREYTQQISLLMCYLRVSELNFEILSTHTFLIDVKQLVSELMKEILQIKVFKQQTSVLCLMFVHCIISYRIPS